MEYGAYSFWEALIRVIIFLPIVVGLAYLVIKLGFAKRYLRQKGRHIQVVEQVMLSPKSSLNIVKVDDRYMLIGTTDSSVTLIKELDSFDEGSVVEEETSQFAGLLKKLTRGGKVGE